MVHKKFCLGILVMALVFGMSVVGCGSDSDGGDNSPLSKTVTWTASSTNYKLVLTDLAAAGKSVSRTVVPGGRTYVYNLSVGSSGFNTGTATISDDNITFTPSSELYTGASNFTITIAEGATDGAVTVTVTTEKQIPLLTGSGTPTTGTLSQATNATGTVATTNASSNPFVGSWSGDGVSVTVRSNLTWSASVPGQYSGSGSYSPLDNAAIVYDSKKNLFGYAWMDDGNMETITADGGEITFRKKK